jgi:hypothetical protein
MYPYESRRAGSTRRRPSTALALKAARAMSAFATTLDIPCPRPCAGTPYTLDASAVTTLAVGATSAASGDYLRV